MTQFDQDIADFEADEAARIATLHATAPAKIYLQLDPDAEQFEGWDAQTWCSDEINSTDLCYVRKSDSDAEIAELKVVSDHNLATYHQAAQKLREQLGVTEDHLRKAEAAFEIENEKLREQVIELQGQVGLLLRTAKALAATDPAP